MGRAALQEDLGEFSAKAPEDGRDNGFVPDLGDDVLFGVGGPRCARGEGWPSCVLVVWNEGLAAPSEVRRRIARLGTSTGPIVLLEQQAGRRRP